MRYDYSKVNLEQLRANVTSPGGTTAAALEVLMQEDGGLGDLMRRVTVTSPDGTTVAAMEVLMQEAGGLGDLMRRATRAAFVRAGELSKIGEEKDLETDLDE